MSGPQPAAAVVAVNFAGVHMVEPVLGAARYTGATSRGDLLLFTMHVTAWPDGSHTTAPYAYRFYAPRHQDPRSAWLPVYGDSSKVCEFVTNNPVGTVGKISNRTLEVVDFAVEVPTPAIVIPLHFRGETWGRL